MKAKFVGSIDKIDRKTGDSFVHVVLDLDGDVTDAGNINAKPCELQMVLKLKPLVAGTLKFGSKIAVTIEEVAEEVSE